MRFDRKGKLRSSASIPFFAAEKGNFFSLATILNVFWGHKKAGARSTLVEDLGMTESVQNLVCAKFALKPLRKTENGAVVVQFHWLKTNGLKPHHVPLETPYEALPFSVILSKAGLSDNSTWAGKLAHRKNGLPLKTG